MLNPTRAKPSVLSQVPAITNIDEAQDTLALFVGMGSLTPIQKAILIGITEDALSENVRTYEQLAVDIGCHVQTIHYNIANPTFNAALGIMMVAVVRGETHLYVDMMKKLAVKGDYRAVKFMLEYGGTYTKKTSVTSRSMNINVNAGNTQSPETFDEAFDSFLIMCGERGVSVEKITERYLQLRREHAW